MSWIIEKIQDELDSIPRNIGKAMKLNYQTWLISHSGKLAIFNPTKCDDCKGHGILWYSKVDTELGYKSQHYCICATCDNWKRYFNQIDKEIVRSRASLLEQGFQLEGPTKDFPEMTVSDSVKSMTKKVGTSIKDIPLEREPKYCCEQAKHGGILMIARIIRKTFRMKPPTPT